MKHFFTTQLFLVLLFSSCTEKQAPISVQEATSILSDTITVAADTNQYLYDFIKMVEKDQKLNYSFGLTLEVENALSHEDDETYLFKFLKVALEPETIRYYSMPAKPNDSTLAIERSDSFFISLKTPPPIFFVPSTVTFPNHIGCLNKRDIKYMLSEKRRLQNFKWNNQRLGFNLANKNNWYRFSLPYFSKDKKTALICIRSLCKPFLCGDGYVLLYRFENNTWTSTKVDYWIH